MPEIPAQEAVRRIPGQRQTSMDEGHEYQPAQTQAGAFVPPETQQVLAERPAPNRRAQPRYLAHWRAVMVRNGVRYAGRTDNVSLSGVAILSDVTLPPRQEVEVYLEIPLRLGKPPVIFAAVGMVMHCTLTREGFKVGLAFRSFTADSQGVLRHALSSGAYRELFDPNFS